MVGVILAAGDGKRLKDSAKEDHCKPLIKIKEKRLIEYALDNLVELGLTKVYIVVGKEGTLIKKVLGDKYGCLKLFYVVQSEQKGLVDAFAQAVNAINSEEPIVLQLSDEIFTGLKIEAIKNCIKTESHDFYCGITFEDNIEKIKCNYSVDIKDDYVIKKCVEKPTHVPNNIKGTGFCVFNREALQVFKIENSVEKENLYDLCDYINYLTACNKNGLALHIAEKEFNINTFTDLFEAQDFLCVD